MPVTRTTGSAWISLAVPLCGLVAASACAPKAGRRQTDVMEKSGALSVSAAELRAGANDLADRFVGRLEETADRIRAESQDRVVRRRALAFKIDAIPAVYSAAYRADPFAGGIDLWALAFQLDRYLDDGPGRDAFGAEQPLARKAARDLLADADTFARGITARPEDFVRARAQVEGWAKTHPVEHTLASRASITAFAAKMRSEGRDAFVAVGAISDTVENVSERLNTYAAQLPRRARWEAELLALEMAEDREVEKVLGDVHAVGAAARRADALLGDVPGLLGSAGSPMGALLAAERRAVLAAVNDQRLATLEYATMQRLAVLAAVREERIAVVAALHEERVETLKEVDVIKSRAVDYAVVGLRELVDYTLWRVAALLMGALVSAALLGVVGYWLTVGRRRTPSTL